MKYGWLKVSKREWYQNGGFRNSRCIRRADSRGRWRYYMLFD